jgi:hypothetical protein
MLIRLFYRQQKLLLDSNRRGGRINKISQIDTDMFLNRELFVTKFLLF